MTMPSTDGLAIVAETGASHCRSYAKALALIDAARQAGADAVKFSAFRPEQMTLDSIAAPFVVTDGPWKGQRLYELYEKSALPYDWIPDLKRATQAAGLKFILSIYHPDTIPLVCDWAVKTVKIASFELDWPEFLNGLAKSPIPNVILSTGSATIPELGRAVRILSDKHLTFLYCVSAYPPETEKMNLLTIKDMKEHFCFPIGFSDHTTGITAPVTAVALGACMIEKHIKVDDKGLDSSFAVFPDRFYAMVEACREAKAMLGEARYGQPKTYHRKEIDGQMVRVVW